MYTSGQYPLSFCSSNCMRSQFCTRFYYSIWYASNFKIYRKSMFPSFFPGLNIIYQPSKNPVTSNPRNHWLQSATTEYGNLPSYSSSAKSITFLTQICISRTFFCIALKSQHLNHLNIFLFTKRLKIIDGSIFQKKLFNY